MRVLHVIPSYAPAFSYGGPVVSVETLAIAQVAAGATVSVITTDLNGRERLKLPQGRRIERAGVGVQYLATIGRGAFAYSPTMGPVIDACLPDIDIVHVHGLFAYPTIAGCRRASLAGVPYILSPRGMLDPHAIRRRSCRKKMAYIRLVESRHVAHAAAVHFTTVAERDLAREILPVPRAEVVANPVPPMAEPPTEAVRALVDRTPALGRQADRPKLLFLGRIDPKKGIELTFDAFARASVEADLIIAGSGSEHYLASLKERARARGIGERVAFVGFVSGEEKQALISLVDAFILTSYSENFGNAAVEAMSAGLPVILSDRVNLAPAAAAEGAAIMTPCDVDAVAAALSTLLGPATNRAAIGEAGRRWALRETDPAAVADAMMALYAKYSQRTTVLAR